MRRLRCGLSNRGSIQRVVTGSVVIFRTPVVGELFMASTTKAGMRLLLRHGHPRGLPSDYFDHVYKTFDRGTKRAVLRLYRNTQKKHVS